MVYKLKPVKDGYIRLSDLYPNLKNTQIKKDTDYVKCIIQREETFKLISKALLLLENKDEKGLKILTTLKSNVYFLQKQEEIKDALTIFFTDTLKVNNDFLINEDGVQYKLTKNNLQSIVYRLSLGNIDDTTIDFNKGMNEFNIRKECYKKNKDFISSLDCGPRRRHIQYRCRFRKYLKMLTEEYFNLDEVRNSIMWNDLDRYFNKDEIVIIREIERVYKCI